MWTCEILQFSWRWMRDINRHCQTSTRALLTPDSSLETDFVKEVEASCV